MKHSLGGNGDVKDKWLAETFWSTSTLAGEILPKGAQVQPHAGPVSCCWVGGLRGAPGDGARVHWGPPQRPEPTGPALGRLHLCPPTARSMRRNPRG